MRVDTHVVDGYAIPPYYDSLVAKVIVWAEDRPGALARARRALSEFELAGVPTTCGLAIDIVRDGGVHERPLYDRVPRRRGRTAAVAPRRGGGGVTSRKEARRQALELLYQWDLTRQPLASLREEAPPIRSPGTSPRA